MAYAMPLVQPLPAGLQDAIPIIESLQFQMRGEGDLADAVRTLKRDTRHYAKRQETWFAPDPEIRWFSPGDAAGVEACLRPFLSRESP